MPYRYAKSLPLSSGVLISAIELWHIATFDSVNTGQEASPHQEPQKSGVKGVGDHYIEESREHERYREYAFSSELVCHRPDHGRSDKLSQGIEGK